MRSWRECCAVSRSDRNRLKGKSGHKKKPEVTIALRQGKRLERPPVVPVSNTLLCESHIQPGRSPRFEFGMPTPIKPLKGNGHLAENPTLAAMRRMELYCAANPGSPTTARMPQLLYRGQLWVALLGPSAQEGIVGIGQTVEGALRAFDAQYLAGLRPPSARFRRGIYHSKAAPRSSQPGAIRT